MLYILSIRRALRLRATTAIALVTLLMLGEAAVAQSAPGQSGNDNVPGADTSNADPGPADDYAVATAGGNHWRLNTVHGPVHVWTPSGYRHETAGIVIYAHGYYIDVDRAWHRHTLAMQFAASGRNALFIIPEVPARIYHRLRWRNLGHLIREVKQQLARPHPWGPVVVIGHSGAYRSILPWLEYPALGHVILLDALYAHEQPFVDWLEQPEANGRKRLSMVSIDTLRWSEILSAGLPYAQALDWVPEDVDDVSPAAQNARLLHIRSQYDHMEIVTAGKTIPVLLRLTELPALPAPQTP